MRQKQQEAALSDQALLEQGQPSASPQLLELYNLINEAQENPEGFAANQSSRLSKKGLTDDYSIDSYRPPTE